MTSSKTLIKIKDAWKIYKMGAVEVPALRGLSLKVNQGDFVVIMGPSGSGKCLTGDTKLFLEDGSLINLKDFERKYKKYKVLALDRKSNKIKPFRVSDFYKREANQIYEITTSSGKKIVSTPEHPFFTLDSNGFSEIRATNLKKGIFVATARKINTKPKKQEIDLLKLASANKRLYLFDSSKLIRKLLKNSKISGKELCKKLKFNYFSYDAWKHNNNISLENFKKIMDYCGTDISEYKCNFYITPAGSHNKVRMPKKISKDLMELYGFIAGDGNLDKDGIKFTNLDPKINERFSYLVNRIFEVDAKKFMDTRLAVNNKVLLIFFNKIFNFPLNLKSRKIKLPEFVFRCSNKEIAAFIRALFDCDGYVSKNKKEVAITLASKDLITQLNYLLLRYGIVSRLPKKFNKKTNRFYYLLSISGLNNLKLYEKHIGFISSDKKKRLLSHLKNKENTNVDVIPCGELLQKVRRESKVKVSRRIHKVLNPYESKRINPSVNKLKLINNLLSENKINTDKLSALIDSDIFWDKVIAVKKINKKTTVYDITVPGADNFIANEFIVHNSTAMNMIGCLDVPTKGKIYLNGKDISSLEESELAQIRGSKIGFVFQKFNLIQSLTAIENVALTMVFQNISKEERIKRASELLDIVGLEHRKNHLPSEMSGGEQQRVAIARSLANDPEIILADEPTGNLDSKTGKKIVKILIDLWKNKNKTLIIVTHDSRFEKLARDEKVFYLKDGRVENEKSN